MFKRVLGLIMLLIGLVGVGVSIFGAMAARDVVNGVGTGLDDALASVSASLDTVQDTLTLSGELVTSVSETLSTVDAAAVDLAATVDETRPLIAQIGSITSSDVPAGIEAVQETIPNLAEVAGTIDDTLTALSDFRLDERVLGVPIRFDLGIRYEPTEPFDESILQIGTSLEGLPEQLRGLDAYLVVTDENLNEISRNTQALAADLGRINERVEEVQPLLDQYSQGVTDVQDSIQRTRANLTTQVTAVNRGLLLVFLWLGLAQAAPLYLGVELLRGKELTDEDQLVRRVEPTGDEGARDPGEDGTETTAEVDGDTTSGTEAPGIAKATDEAAAERAEANGD